MNVLSLFDGMSVGLHALKAVGIPVESYIASEIDPYAIKVSKKNHPEIRHVGSVSDINYKGINWIDLLIGGSPCQGFSFAGKQLNFNDPRSKLFWEFVRILKQIRQYNPNVKFMLENVQMKQEFQDIISEALGVAPIKINSALVSAQNRKRFYWTNISGITQPADRGILLRDILENPLDRGVIKDRGDKSQCLDANYFKGVDNHGQRTCVLMGLIEGNGYDINRRVYSPDGKAPTLLSKSTGGQYPPKILTDEQIDRAKRNYEGKMWPTGNYIGSMRFPDSLDKKSKALTSCIGNIGNRAAMHIPEGLFIRMLSPIECERLQGLPDNYTGGVSNTQRYKMLGNGWQSDTIQHIFNFLE